MLWSKRTSNYYSINTVLKFDNCAKTSLKLPLYEYSNYTQFKLATNTFSPLLFIYLPLKLFKRKSVTKVTSTKTHTTNKSRHIKMSNVEQKNVTSLSGQCSSCSRAFLNMSLSISQKILRNKMLNLTFKLPEWNLLIL